MRVRPRTLLLSFLVLLAIGLALASYELIRNTDYIKALLLKQVEQQLGRQIEVADAKLVLLPRLRLELTGVVVREANPAHVFFTAQRLELILRAIPLLRQQVVGKRLTIEQPKVVLRRDRSGRWNFADGSQQGGITNPLTPLLMVKETVIRGGEVTIVDELRPDGSRHLKVAKVDVSINVGPQGNRAEMGLSATLLSPQGVSAVSLVGTVSYTPSVLAPPSGMTASGPFIQFEGAAETLNLDIPQIVDFFGEKSLPPGVRGVANLRGHIRLVPGVAGYDMVLSDISAHIEGLRIAGHASLSGLFAAQPTFSVTFTTSPLTIAELLKRIPLDKMHPELLKVLEERQISAKVEVVNATLSGSTAPEPRFSTTGELRISEGQAIVGDDRVPARNFSGSVFVEPGRLRLMELSGQYGPLRINGGKGLVTLLETEPKLELEIVGDMAGGPLVSLLARRIHTPTVSKTFASLTDVSGTAVLTLRLAGLLTQLGNLQFLGGEFVLQDMGFELPSVPEPIAGLAGRIRVSKQNVELDKLEGRLGKTRFDVNGVLAISEKVQFQSLTVHTKLNVEQWLRFLPANALGAVTLTGAAEATAEASGPIDQPRLKATVDIHDAALSVPGWIQKAAGTPGIWNFEAALGPGSVLNVEQAELLIPPVKVSGKGKVRLTSNHAFDATLVSGPLQLSGLPQGVTLFGLEDGTLEVSLDIRGAGSDWHNWRLTGWVALTDGVVRPKGIDDPISNIYLRLKLIRNGADLKRLALRLRGNDLRVAGTIRNWHRIPTVELQVDSSQLDLEILFPKDERSPVRDALEAVASSSRVTAAVAIDRGMFKEFMIKDISCRVNMRDSVLDVDRIVGQSQGGTLAGRFILRLPEQAPLESELAIRVSSVPFEELAHSFGAQEHIITGTTHLTGTLQGSGKHVRNMLPTLNGKVDLVIERGRILKLTALSKILTIMNLPVLLQGKVNLTKDGMPFDKITSTLRIHEGLVETENLVVDSPVMKMSGAGRYNLIADQVDFVMAVSPFGSYSQLLKSIPLFGKLLAGERKGLDTALFEVKGSLMDPEVDYLSIRSFATGLTGLALLAFDVLKNAVMLPKDLISPDSTENGKAPVPAVPERVPELGAPTVGEAPQPLSPDAAADRTIPHTPAASP